MKGKRPTKPHAGMFQKGNPGGPGRPKRAVEEQYLVALKAGVPLQRWCAVVARALEQAENGDKDARAWLSKYLLPDGTADAAKELATAIAQVVVTLPDNGRGDRGP